MPGSVAMNRALISNEGGETVETLLAEPSEGLQVRPSETEPVSPLSLAVSDPINAGSEPFSVKTSTAPAPGLTANGLPHSTPRSRSPLPSGSPSSNPFFGSSGVTRERLSKSAASAQSGSGKVISGLQSDLLQARSALESTRGQLRLSQRAVEHLGRQTGEFRELWSGPERSVCSPCAGRWYTEDLRETKERLSSEIQGLNRQLARKERLQDEALARARAAEASLATVQKELADLKATVKSRMKELEEGAKRAEEAKVRTEREYTALRDGLRYGASAFGLHHLASTDEYPDARRTMQDGWRDDLRWLKDDLKRTQRELDTKTSTSELSG